MWEPYKKEKCWSFRILLDTVYNYSYFVSGDLSYRTCIISYHLSKWVCCYFVIWFFFYFSVCYCICCISFFKLYFVMQNNYICNTSFYCYKTNFKKWKMYMWSNSAYMYWDNIVFKCPLKNNTSCLFSIYVYANITLLMYILKYVLNVSLFNLSTLHICYDIEQVY